MSDEAGEIREDERLDVDRLRPFLTATLGPGRIELRQFHEGHSNLTYLVRAGGREAVLRRAPIGASVKHGHDMRREFEVLTALDGVYPRAPRPIAFCDDASLIGAPFFLMEQVRGFIFRGAPAFTPELARLTSLALVDNLAELHAVDPARLRGRPEGYVGRQVTGWTERWQAARTEEVPSIDSAAAWLATHQPPESGAAVVHGDYKYDNLVFDPVVAGRIVAVLDWEMATVGDPLMDLGTMLGYWVDPDDAADLRARPYGPTLSPGSLSRREIVERYGERTGRAGFDPLFYYVFALFKLAVIVQQIHRRWVLGLTRDERFASLGARVRTLGVQAARALDRGRIHGLGA